jgi:ATP-dependent RNA helicase DDX49/DBP8
MTGRKRRVLTTDDLLRRQEEPVAKKLKISLPLGFDGLDETSSELNDETSEEEEELTNNEVQRGKNRRRSAGDADDDSDDALLDGKDDEPLTSGESESEFSVTLERSGLQGVKTKPMSQKPLKPTGATFASLGVSAPLQASLAAMSIRTPTEVQAACIPPLLAGQ